MPEPDQSPATVALGPGPVSPATSRRKLIVALLIFAAILLALWLICLCTHSKWSDCVLRTDVAFVIAAAVIVFTFFQMLEQARTCLLSTTPDDGVKFWICFMAVAFVCLGAALTVGLTAFWCVALLSAGGFLLGGGFVGMLFGVSYGPPPVPKPDSGGTDNGQTLAANATTTTVVQQAEHHAHTLMQEAASWLSKIFTGAILVKYQTVEVKFLSVGHSLGALIASGSCLTMTGSETIVGGSVIVYFALTGFLAGILLPAYFMKKFLDGQ